MYVRVCLSELENTIQDAFLLNLLFSFPSDPHLTLDLLIGDCKGHHFIYPTHLNYISGPLFNLQEIQVSTTNAHINHNNNVIQSTSDPSLTPTSSYRDPPIRRGVVNTSARCQIIIYAIYSKELGIRSTVNPTTE